MTKKEKKFQSRFIFKKYANVGAIDAQEDSEFLYDCFVDTGALNVLRDVSKSECIVLGRTGVGKTALLAMLEDREENVTSLSPFELALNYLANRPALQFYLEIGIDLDLFFRVLWRHIFATELIKLVGSSNKGGKVGSFFDSIIRNKYTSQYKRSAQEYLSKYPDFWLDTESRVKHEIDKLEREINGKIGGVANSGIVEANANIGFSSKMSHEEKAEIAKIGQEVVNQRQMRELTMVMDLLGEELPRDKQRKYFITIDKLDENWINDMLRFKLLRALMETIRDYNVRIYKLKIVCAIREDLLDRIFRFTRSVGDQQDKYRSLYLQLHWKPSELKHVIENRINRLIQHQYAKRYSVRISDVMPKKVREKDTLKFVIERTLYTPRDVIMFFNECIKQAEDRAKINQKHVLTAEGIYSESRLRALSDEWSADYTTLGEAAFILKQMDRSFKVRDLDKSDFGERLLNYLIRAFQTKKKDYIYKLIEEKMDFDEIVPELLRIFFQVGIVGVKREAYLETYWSHEGKKLPASDINEEASIHIHPAFFRILGVRP